MNNVNSGSTRVANVVGFVCFFSSRILDDRSLRIKKVKASDEGIYVCRVENKLGWQEAEARLSVNGK
jgi:Immunoglobulin I-set domain